MPEYLSPGVYIEEIQSGPRPITAVATSTAGMAGVTRRGPATPTLVTCLADFRRIFGEALELPDPVTRGGWAARGRYWQAAESVQAFFDEGGARMFFQRVAASGAVTADTTFNGGLFAGLEADVTPTSTTVTLTHTVGVVPGGSVTLVDAAGTVLGGALAVTAVDRATRTVTLGVAAGVAARAGVDVARILAANNAAVLTVGAASAGFWGNDLRVRILPVTSRLRLAATPASGAQISVQTISAAAAADTTITVNDVPGVLDAATPVPFSIRVAGADRYQVTAAAAAPAAPGGGAANGVVLTLGSGLSAALPAGSPVDVVRPAAAGPVVSVSGAGRLYPGALLQLESAGGVETAVVRSVAGGQVTLTAAPAGTYQEGDWLALVEGEVSVRYAPVGAQPVTEVFSGLRLTQDDHPQSLLRRVNTSNLIRVQAGAGWNGTALQSFPASAGPVWRPLVNGDDLLATLAVGDFVGTDNGPGQRTGIQALQDVDEVAICAVPGMYAPEVLSALQVHCESQADRFAVFDCPPGQSVQQVQAFRSPFDTTFAALYYPWVKIRDPRPGGDEILAPPSGFVAGVYARTDLSRGVHKAPANEVLRSIRGLEQNVTRREQDVLNPVSINVLRTLAGRGNRIWGARVLSSDPLWRYVPVRRLFLMIEESIDEATQWAVFEPNDEPLWAQIRQSVRNFLTTQWRIGALQGRTAAQAFYVTCDRTTMTFDDINSGRLIAEIGIAPVKPAEFVIFRIQQQQVLVPA